MTNADLDRVHQRIDAALGKIEKATEHLVAVEATCPLHTNRLTSIETALFGNGKPESPGLLTRFDRMENTRRLAGQLIAALMGLLTGGAGTTVAWLMNR